jgi:hypothetical protein
VIWQVFAGVPELEFALLTSQNAISLPFSPMTKVSAIAQPVTWMCAVRDEGAKRRRSFFGETSVLSSDNQTSTAAGACIRDTYLPLTG